MTMPKPVYDCTPFSELNDHGWYVLSNRFNRGIDWCIQRVGRKWMIGETFGKCWPLYKTKTAAFDALEKMIIAEAYLRGYKRAMAGVK